MKPIRFLIKNSALALLCFSSFSCVNEAYDLSNLSSEAQLFKNSLSAPVGTLTIHMDSIIGGMNVDASVLTVKDGIYVFGYSGNFNLSKMTDKFNDVKLANLNNVNASVNLFDASAYPPGPAFPLPQTAQQTYPGTAAIDLPAGFGNVDPIEIDSIILKNTFLKISTKCVGLVASNNKPIGDYITATFKPKGTAAEYYVNGVKSDEWTIRLGEPTTVEIHKINMTGDATQLGMDINVSIQVPTLGDIMVTERIKTYVEVLLEFTDGIDYNVVWGKVDYALDRSDIDPIRFEGLGDIISENDLLSIYNPKITLKTVGNLGVPIDLNLFMSATNSNTGQTSPGLTDATFHMQAATRPETPITSTKTIDRTNGTDGLFKINPDIINMGYDGRTVIEAGKNHFISKNSQLSLDYNMEIPLQFGNDLHISVDTTLENPFGDNLDILDNQEDMSVAINLNVENRIPLNMQIKLEALDANNNSLFTVQTDTIMAANTTNGLSTSAALTNTDILLSPDQINKLKDTKMFGVSFIVTSNQDVDFVSVQPSDYITIKIGGKINGGVILDLSNNSK